MLFSQMTLVMITLSTKRILQFQFSRTDSLIKTKTLFPFCNIEDENKGYAEGIWKIIMSLVLKTLLDTFIWHNDTDSIGTMI